jgi:catechol 2,3-dioxygenase-like lactoylglutathione lyase family enzyme
MIPKPHRASIVFYVSDIVRTENFYRDALGLELVRQEGAEPFWLTGRLDGGLELMFFQMDAVRGTTPALVFDLPEGGIDDVVESLVAKGVTLVTPVSEAPGGFSADFADPDGFGLGLYQSGDKPRSSKGRGRS